MNTSKIILAATLSLLAGSGTHAEIYDGVLTVHPVASRAEVEMQAVATARAGNIYSDGANAGVLPALTTSVDRATVQNEAMQSVRLGNVYGEDALSGVLSVGGGRLDRAAVRAEAHAATRTNSMRGL